MKTGHIFFVMWIAGSGKGTLIKNLRENGREDLYFPLSYTTRPMRPGEVHGKGTYYFVTRWDFLQGVENSEFLEYAFVHQMDYYGTKMFDVYDEGVKKWKTVVKELEIHGLKKLRSERPEFDLYYSTVFLNIPKEKLKERIEQRWVFMSEEEYQNRINSSVFEEEELKELCDYVIDATLPPEEVVQAFLKIVDTHQWNSIL